MTRAFLREVIYERIPGKKEEQEIEGAGREKDTQIIPAHKDGKWSLSSPDSIIALFILLPSFCHSR